MTTGTNSTAGVKALALAELTACKLTPHGVDPDQFRAQQIMAVKRTTPHMMTANILAAMLVSVVAWGTSASATVLLWAAMMAGVSIYILVAGLKRPATSITRSRVGPHATRKANTYAGVIGAMWAMLPALTFGNAPLEVCFIIMGVTMGACGLGAFNLSPIPSAALIYASLVTAALGGASFMLGGSVGITAALLGLIYGIALAAMIVQSHHKELQRAERDLAMENQNGIIKLLLREFESGTKDWLWETDADCKLTYASERLIQISGKKRSRVVGATLRQAVSANRSQQGWVKLVKATSARAPIELIEVPIRSGSTNTWWQINASPVFDEKGEFKGYRGVAVDITEIRGQTAQLVKSKQVAERANVAKSQFLAMMSHELRTPLNAIVGYAELIVVQNKNSSSNKDHAEYAQNIADQGNHLNQLISNILDATRIERGKVELIEQEIDLDELVEIVIKMCRIQAQTAKVALSERYAVSGLIVNGDLTRLKQILINLTANAIKFTPVNGSVEIIIDQNKKGCPQISVSDTGVGIEQSKIEQMFEPFVQAESTRTRRYEGAGLGLAISRELARMHGGDISLRSRPGNGTTATLMLPIHRVVVSSSSARQIVEAA